MTFSPETVRRHLLPFLRSSYISAVEAPKSPADDLILPLCELLLSLSPAEARAFYADPGGASTTNTDRFWNHARANMHTFFLVYSGRAVWLSLEERSGPRLLSGLLAFALTHEQPDWRDLQVGLAPYHHCAQILGLNTPALFARVGRYAAAADEEKHYVTFGQRRDVTLGAFGWVQVETPYGQRFRQSM